MSLPGENGFATGCGMLLAASLRARETLPHLHANWPGQQHQRNSFNGKDTPHLPENLVNGRPRSSASLGAAPAFHLTSRTPVQQRTIALGNLLLKLPA